MDNQSISKIYQEIQKTHQKDPECLNLIYNYQVSPEYRNWLEDFSQDSDVEKEINLICDKKKFKQELKNEIDRKFRYNGIVSLIIFHFDLTNNPRKKFNYKYWDLLLLRLSELISRKIRKADILARWSRDVLLIVNPDTKLISAIKSGKRVIMEINKQRFDEIGNLDPRFGVTELRPKENCSDFLNRVEQAIELLKEKEDLNLYIFS